MPDRAEALIGTEFTGTVVDYKYVDGQLVLLLEGEAAIGEAVVLEQAVETRTEVYCNNWHKLTAKNTSMTRDGYLRCMACVAQSRKRLSEKVRRRATEC